MKSFRHYALRVIVLLSLAYHVQNARAQCTWYTITVTDGATASEVTWELVDALGVTWASGGAPWNEDICLPDGCYTLLMFDSGGDGWEDVDWFIADWTGDFDWDTNLPDGPHGTDTFVLGANQPCDPIVIGATCPPGTQTLQFIVTAGTAPAQITWSVSLNGTALFSGGANFNDTLCLGVGCYVVNMFDAGANGWQGATYTLQNFGGPILYTGTLGTGSTDADTLSIGGANCSTQGGGACGNTGNPTGDCPTVVCACDPFTFPITPSGFGTINEIPFTGSVSNPAYGGVGNPPPWGGLDYGCLLANELNSSWILITIGIGGSLGFSFGAGGQQVGYYDWAMWPYTGPATCSAIMGNTLPPVRCVWNAAPWGGAGLANVIPAGGDPGNYAPQLPVLAGQQYIICMSNWSYVTADVTLDFFGTATISCDQVLPIELLSFTGACENDKAVLRWSTATETNNDYFTVERSVDSDDWEAIGTVPGAGNSQQVLNYVFNDPYPSLSLQYYRIKQTDLNGAFTYSPVVAAEACADRTVKKQWLIDASGRVCGEWPASRGSFAPGIYLVRSEFNTGASETKKMIVLAPR